MSVLKINLTQEPQEVINLEVLDVIPVTFEIGDAVWHVDAVSCVVQDGADTKTYYYRVHPKSSEETTISSEMKD